MPDVNLVVGDDGANALQGTSGPDLIYGFDPDGPQGQVTSIIATQVTAGLTQPVFVGAPPGDDSRLFVVEQGGLIKIIDLATNEITATPFLDVSDEIIAEGEQGLLGLAFDPSFAQNGYFYVNLINVTGDTEIRRYQVSADPDQANAASAALVISVDQPNGLGNHKAGWLGFGPDGYLYVALGDGGGGGDPFNNAQNINSLLGKMLRLDVAGDAFPADDTRNYAIPADNPFVGVAGADEIWALGLRNPWRNSFDRGLGDLFIADVGQNEWEEIDLGLIGANYGWDIFEGPDVFSPGTPSAGALTAPIHYYGRDVGNVVAGGYVYRGSSEGLHGQYFFADTGSNRFFSLRHEGDSWIATERTSQIAPDVGFINSPVSFGEDGRGDLYVVDYDGDIFRLTPLVVSTDQADQLQGHGGEDVMIGGSGDDDIEGGTGDDVLNGGNGNDGLDGGAGNDTMVGGDGNDAYVVDVPFDLVFERASEGGADLVQTSLAVYTLTANVENLTGTSGAGQTLNGNELVNTITGGAGADTLNSFGGNDTMVGGDGDDTYIVDATGDVITEGSGGSSGLDVAVVFANYTLSANVEVIYGLNSGIGLTLNGIGGNDTIYGSNHSDTINGGGGNDTLLGFDGTNAMAGGSGDDTYYTVSATDTLTEGGSAGFDLAVSTYNITLGANFEQLVLIGGATSGTGNGDDNFISGFNSTNALTLDGAGGNDFIYGSLQSDNLIGGAGNDLLIGVDGTNTMTGGADDDVYYSFSATDTIVEGSGAGTGFDTVVAFTSITLSNNIEQLILQGNGTTATGTGGNEIIYGLNSGLTLTLDGAGGNDTIYGSGQSDSLIGGAGNDIMLGFSGTNSFTGGTGDDQYYTSSATDILTEGAVGGNDIVIASYNSTLGANFEQLIVIGGATSGTGNGDNNVLNGSIAGAGVTLDGAGGNDNFFGSSFADVMTGGTGNDTMFGGGGDDLFRFPTAGFGDDIVSDFVTTAANAANHDLIDLQGLGESFGTLNISYSGIGATITIGADTIFLTGVTSGLQNSDFLF